MTEQEMYEAFVDAFGYRMTVNDLEDAFKDAHFAVQDYADGASVRYCPFGMCWAHVQDAVFDKLIDLCGEKEASELVKQWSEEINGAR